SGRATVTKTPAVGRQREAAAPPGVAHPPVGVSLARGVSAVVSSPVLVVSSLLVALVLWGIFAAIGVLLAATPGVMALLESLPPVHSFFLDLRLVVAAPNGGGVGLAIAALAVLGVRAFLLGFWTVLLADGLRGIRRPWRETIRHASRLAGRAIRPLLAIEAGSLALAMVALFLSLGFLGAGLGQLAVLGSLIGSFYFLVFSPVIATLEGGSLRWVARTSIRTARIPGPRHMLLTTLYVAIALFVSTLTPGSRVASATPSIAVWAYVLFVGLIHLAVLGAIVYRWLFVREAILAQASGEPGAPAGSAIEA
ncbi:MAG TPA: hypothetical protein VEM93_09640, partial [Actinomycetota bacterium]|nr:hypothetical protein [Actinomycetota bacterium]